MPLTPIKNMRRTKASATNTATPAAAAPAAAPEAKAAKAGAKAQRMAGGAKRLLDKEDGADAEGPLAKAAKKAGHKHEEKETLKGVEVTCGAVSLKSIEGLSKATRRALKDRGISSLFEVQHRSFRPILSGLDTVGRAKTGCGKTLAYVLPVVERIAFDGLSTGKAGRTPLVLALAPTRELAKQIQTELSSIASGHGLTSTCLYGGAPFLPQADEVRAGLDAVVATPGRLLDHLKRETLSLRSVRFVVLDEADEMLSMGFQDDVEEILSHMPASAQKLLFSATMPKWVQNLVAKHLRKDHAVVDVVGEAAENQANANITHQCISCSPFERGDTLADLCKVHAGAFGKTLVFTGTKKECDDLAQNATLVQMGAGLLHGDIPQKSREVTMKNFRTGKIKLLIATDVAARGLDVPNVDLVVMTHPPQDLDTYVHRSGRTARAGRTGTCVTFYSRNEEYLLRLLKHKKGIPLKRRGPPQPCEIVAQAARDAIRQVDYIHQDNVEAFTRVAEELIEERGSPVFLLAASLAAMTGYTARIKCRSLLTSYEGAVAMLLESEREIEQTNKAWYLLRNNVPEEVAQAAKAMTVVKGRRAAVFDVPQEHVDKVLKAEIWKGLKLSVAKELPELEPHHNENNSVRDDEWAHADSQRQRWEKIKRIHTRDAQERQERRHFDSGGDGRGRGGRGRGIGGRGGDGLDKGRGRGRP